MPSQSTPEAEITPIFNIYLVSTSSLLGRYFTYDGGKPGHRKPGIQDETDKHSEAE